MLDRENRLGALKGKSRKEQEQLFRDKAGRQLLVAMREATLNRRFEEKAIDELLELESESRQVYALIAVASAFRFSLSRDEILLASGDQSNATLNAMNLLAQRRLVTQVQGKENELQARHRVIAEIILEELQRRGQLKDVLFGLALVAATKVHPSIRRNERPWRLLRQVINHEFLERALGCESARNLYGAIEQLLSWDHHYWLQRGSMEVEFGDVGLAENFLNQSRGLAPDDDPLVENEWAYLLFKKALASPGSLGAPDYVNQATAILEELISRRGRSDPYPYHVLGSQGLAWARRGLHGSVEKERYLLRIIKRIEEGVGRHPRADDLKQLLDDLRKEHLSIAVRQSR